MINDIAMSSNKKKGDKIFGNDYNTGNIEFEFFGKIKIKDDGDFSGSKFMDYSYQSWVVKELQEELHEIFINSDFREKYSKIKKVPKNEMVRIYYHFADNLTKDKYSAKQVFIEIAEFMRMNYKDMYHQLLPVDKQRIVQELDAEYNAINKKQKRLF